MKQLFGTKIMKQRLTIIDNEYESSNIAWFSEGIK